MNPSHPNKSSRRDFASVAHAAILVAFISLSALAGCSLPTVGPNYRRPDTPAAATYSDTSDQSLIAVGNRVTRDWWRAFGDPELDRCISEALTENQNIKGALARVEQARALTSEARASYLPMI